MKKLITVVFALSIAMVLTLGSVVQGISVIEDMEKANIDWRSHAGETITVNLSRIQHSDSVVELIPEFEKATGMRVNFELLSDEEYWNKLTIDFASGAGFFDVVYTGNIFYNYIAAGWLEPLTSYVNDPELTDPEWFDVDDFWAIAWETNMWDGKTIGPNTYGRGDIYAIPLDSQSTILTYRKDLMAKYGVTVPQSWPELAETAEKMTKDGDYGFISRGSRKWSTISYNGYSNGYWAYGASDFDADLNPLFTSPEAIEFTELWADLVRKAAPPGYLSFTWEEASTLFRSGGNYGMCIEADTFAMLWENPEISEVTGKLGYAHTPGGPGGHNAGYWTWSIGINSQSGQKEASWLFINWVTGKQALLRASVDYLNYPPSRKSVWFDPQMEEMTNWDNGSYRKVFAETMENKWTKILWTVSPEMVAMNELWGEAVQKVILGQATAKEALGRLSQQAVEIMEPYKN